MRGLDLLVLTGGIGGHGPKVRSLAVDGAAHLGVSVEERRHLLPVPA